MRIAHSPSSSARGMTVRVRHKATIMGAVLSLCVLVAWVSANPSAELFVQLGHSNPVRAVTWSPDGKTLASGSDDNTVKVWAWPGGELLRTLSGHSTTVRAVTWSPDGKTLASGSDDNTVKVWAWPGGELLRTLSGHSNPVRAVTWSPDGETLASGSDDNTVKVWAWPGGELLRTLSGHSNWVRAVTWSPDGKTLASGSDDNTVKVWAWPGGELLRTLSGHSNWVRAVTWSPDGKTLASGSDDNTVKVWAWPGGELLRTLSGHSNWVRAVTWSPDGKTLASGSDDNTVKVWAWPGGELLRTLSGHSNWVSAVTWSPDGKTLASGSGDNTVKVWAWPGGELLRTLTGHSNWVWAVTWSPDGKTLASGSGDNTVKVWAWPGGELLRTLSGHSNWVSAVTWSPDGKTLASGSGDNTVKVWAWPGGELLRTLSGHSNWVSAVTWSPDGKTLASGSNDSTVKVWAWPGGELLRTLTGHSNWVWAVTWSPDSKTLASGSGDNTVKVWAWPGGELLRTLSGHSNWVSAVTWSPDGKTLASGSGDNTVKVWAWPGGELLRTLTGHSNRVWAVTWSPDGKTLASGSDDSTVKIWAWPGGELLRTLTGHSNRVWAVTWSPDGKTLASGSGDNTVKVWDTAAGDIQMDITLLPGNEWLAYHPQKLVYNSSLQGDEYAAIRFDKQPYPVYPLQYYRQELKRTDLAQAFFLPQPVIQPKRLRWWWDRTDNKGWWLGGTLLLLSTGAGVTFILRKRADPMAIARQFFAMAGFQKVETASATLLRLYPPEGPVSALVTLWHDSAGDEVVRLTTALRPRMLKGEDGGKLYVVYKEHGPSSDVIAMVRDNLGCETIPLASPLLEKALATNDCARELKELEEPYITRIDPYAEFNPIRDPIWFYGREGMLQRLPAVLAQGQHVGLFGLRKVGKTSLMNQLQQRFVTTPTVFIDCQALAAQAAMYWKDILTQLQDTLHTHGVRRLPQLPAHIDGETFRQHVLALFALWEKSGQRGPFLVILDEIDKFFPDLRIHDSETTLAEYVQCFKVLRGLAQTQRCLVTLVIAYRPDVNRRNLLTPRLGENPMFRSFQEEYVGFLSAADSTAMVREIGQWKRILWDIEAAQRVFHYCGGHPLVTRLFASHACEAGKRKTIDYARVEETAAAIQETFRRNEIGNYYKEGMWDLLREDEQRVLSLICQHGEAGMAEGDLSGALADAVSNVEHFGLAVSREWRVYLTAHLFHTWLHRRLG